MGGRAEATFVLTLTTVIRKAFISICGNALSPEQISWEIPQKCQTAIRTGWLRSRKCLLVAVSEPELLLDTSVNASQTFSWSRCVLNRDVKFNRGLRIPMTVSRIPNAKRATLNIQRTEQTTRFSEAVVLICAGPQVRARLNAMILTRRTLMGGNASHSNIPAKIHMLWRIALLHGTAVRLGIGEVGKYTEGKAFTSRTCKGGM